MNFGIFKHPGRLGSTATSSPLPSSDMHGLDATDLAIAANSSTATLGSQPHPSAVIDKLRSIGLKPVQWVGNCEADRISRGTYDVPTGGNGNYALVFDNTFSKQTSKTATLVLLTYPTAMPPQSGNQVHRFELMTAANGSESVARGSPTLKPLVAASDSTESLQQQKPGKSRLVVRKVRPRSGTVSSTTQTSATIHTGVLQKRRRKRHQGWARRFFSLDFTSSTLSYYHDRNSSALRGAIPLQLAAISANVDHREIVIDSGAEIWHLRATNQQDFASWRSALEAASKQSSKDDRDRNLVAPDVPVQRFGMNPAEEREWQQIEGLVSKVSGSRDAIRRLAKDTDPKYFSTAMLMPREHRPGRSPSPHPSPVEANGDDYFQPKDPPKASFWKRKTSGQSSNSGVVKKAAGGSLAAYSPSSDIPSAGGERKPRSLVSHHDYDGHQIHEHLMAVLRDLDMAVAEFSALVSQSKHRRHPPPSTEPSRQSIESDGSQEFFDALDTGSPLLTIQPDSDDDEEAIGKGDNELDEDEDSLSGSDFGHHDRYAGAKGLRLDNSYLIFPFKPKSLVPLPLDPVKRRSTVLPPTVPPPSLISFLRKNVGKDLSQISTPVTANEPLSMLQRAAECMEYSVLLDKAASATDSVERLIYITAFALSGLSSNRVKERATRKPFNPMLGETFELVREDRGFRLIAEKVSHRPVQIAFQADSQGWSIAQSPRPSQKFWGKSAEITTEGRVRITLHASGERFSFLNATSFLRNIIAGEKYVEPVGELVVVNETTGQKSVSTFKSGGMFSGRSEDVVVKAFDIHGNELPLGLNGTWTASLQLIEHGQPTDKTIWSAGLLVDQPSKRYGFPVFAASLNEITPIEDTKIPPTDSRLRPDQAALEQGDIDKAEELKGKLEENQRERRRDMEGHNEIWRPRWFSRVEQSDEEEVIWRLKTGKDSYWEERAKRDWTGLTPIFAV